MEKQLNIFVAFYFTIQTIRRQWFSKDYILHVFSQLWAGILLVDLICDFSGTFVSSGFDSVPRIEEDPHSCFPMDLTRPIPVTQIPAF